LLPASQNSKICHPNGSIDRIDLQSRSSVATYTVKRSKRRMEARASVALVRVVFFFLGENELGCPGTTRLIRAIGRLQTLLKDSAMDPTCSTAAGLLLLMLRISNTEKIRAKQAVLVAGTSTDPYSKDGCECTPRSNTTKRRTVAI